MKIDYRKHIPGCPGEYCEPVTVGVCHVDVYCGCLRFRCMVKEELVPIGNPFAEEEYNDTKTCVLLQPGDLVRCGGEVVMLRDIAQMERIAETLNRQLPSLENFKEYPNRNTPQVDSDTDFYD